LAKKAHETETSALAKKAQETGAALYHSLARLCEYQTSTSESHIEFDNFDAVQWTTAASEGRTSAEVNQIWIERQLAQD